MRFVSSSNGIALNHGLAFNKTVVTRYRIALEQKHYAHSTINLRLAAVRRLAYEASDSGLLSPDSAAGIRRVKGVRRLGVKIGNWLTAEEGRRLLSGAGNATLRERRNYAMLAVLAGCGLRRAHAAALKIEDPASLRTRTCWGNCSERLLHAIMAALSKANFLILSTRVLLAGLPPAPAIRTDQ